jgi:hypothetical protein
VNGLLLTLALIGQQCPGVQCEIIDGTHCHVTPAEARLGWTPRGIYDINRRLDGVSSKLAGIRGDLGQQCPGGSCADPVAKSRIESTDPQWHDYAVRVHVNHGQTQGFGSGTIVGTGEDGERLVLTAKHVLGGSRQGISVRHKGTSYQARFLAIGSDGDIAALSSNIPGTFPDLRIASESPRQAIMLGYGSSGRLHRHDGRLVGYNTPNGDSGPDARYTFIADSGDSGGGIFNERGEFAGVVWGSRSGYGSMGVSTAKVHKFLNVQRTDLTPSTPGASGKSTTVCFFPPFFKIKSWNNAPQQVEPQPIQPYPVQPQPVVPSPIIQPPTVVQGPQGLPGTQGPQGPPGPAGATPDLSGLLADVAALKGQMASITSILQDLQKTTAATAALVQQPIKFLDPQPDGSEQVRAVGLGGTIRLSIPNPATNHQMQARPIPPTPGK